MINKIIKILNIGRFENYNATGDLELNKMTLVYGENGKGKTTLSSIFRSLKNNDPSFIIERATLGKTEKPEVQIRVDSNNHSFVNDVWDADYKNIEVFDSTFVNKNIFSGESVEHGHKKNLNRFVVGEKGVQLAQDIEDLDILIKEKNNEINVKSTTVQKHIYGNTYSVSDFINIEENKDIDKLIKEKEKEIEVLKKSSVIITKSNLQKMVLPEFSEKDLQDILNKELEGVSKEAETKTREHIKNNLDNYGEKWLESGLKYLKEDENCPFCGQTCESSDLIGSYKGYFNQEYKKLKSNIETKKIDVSNSFSESALIFINKTFESNNSLLDFWKDYVEVEDIKLLFADIQDAWKNLRDLSVQYLKQKMLAPLEQLIIDKDLKIAIENYNSTLEQIKDYNEIIEKINDNIQSKKLEAGGGDLLSANNKLMELKNIKSRFEKDAIDVCTEYSKLTKEKNDLEREKKNKKEKLSDYTKEVFDTYQSSINGYLDKFGAGFQIGELETSYVGGKPSTSYCIKIEQTSVKLGDATTCGTPCFRTVLSQGDKNSLAFAFFLASLDQDDKIQEKIILFDDPISSLDGCRKETAKNEIVKIYEKAKQCIVLSHDKYFLRSISDSIKKEDQKSLIIYRKKSASDIKEWDIIKATLGSYFESFYRMINYVDDGADDSELISIGRCIRPVLEGYYRLKYPKNFSNHEWLGDLIKRIKDDTSNTIFAFSDEQLKELEEINDFSKKFHHETNPSLDSLKITDGELKPFVERTIKVIEQ